MSNPSVMFGSEDGTIGEVITTTGKVCLSSPLFILVQARDHRSPEWIRCQGAALDQVKDDPNVEYLGDGILPKKFMKRQPGTGEGVNNYSVDTGVYVEHEALSGHATWGITFHGYADLYCNVPLSIAAGNYNAAITVGAVGPSNIKASFSNYGPMLDAWKLGVNVLAVSASAIMPVDREELWRLQIYTGSPSLLPLRH
ncbi:hypothetical protein BT69DRAFT_1343865 [Atractiella rhizophila]|nr:hypothetical protein BT69DRAFT_1343865 [Atractiella rhizophila]